MKKLFLSMILMALPLVVCAYDIAVENDDGVTIYYNYYNNGTELEVARSGLYTRVVNIPEEVTYMSRTRKVTSIGESAFSGCSGLTSVTIPNSVTDIGGNAFFECGLTSVTISNSVTSIGKLAFYGCNGLTSVTIPNSVTSIGYDAFYGCSGLTSVHITDLAAWCIIDFKNNPLWYAHHIFLNGEEIKDLVIPNSVTTIGNYAFGGCSGLTSVTIPNSVTDIGESAFSGCSGLTSVTIPNSVTSIGNDAFYGCSGLTSVSIPNSVTTIGNYVFRNCRGLTSVTIPNSVTTIGNYAFGGCSGLTSVTIPNSVTDIGGYAFFGCSGLTSVISKMENPCYIYNICFDQDVFYNATLYVPIGTKEKYKSKDYWNKFLFIVEGEPGSSTLPEEKKCDTPTISYANKKLTFSCATEGAQCLYTITDSDIKTDLANEVSLTATYNISVYATKSGYTNSDVATATLVWTDAIFTETTPETPTSAKAVQESIPVLISAKGGNISVRCEADGQEVNVYTIDGLSLGTATVKNGEALISTSIPSGDIAVVKVGGRSVKVLMR